MLHIQSGAAEYQNLATVPRSTIPVHMQLLTVLLTPGLYGRITNQSITGPWLETPDVGRHSPNQEWPGNSAGSLVPTF